MIIDFIKEWKLLLVFGLVVAVAAIGITAGLRGISERGDIRREIKEIKARKNQVINVDSLRTVIERHVSDSFKIVLAAQDKRINETITQLKKSNDKVDALQTRIRSITVSMPDFH